MGKSKFHGRGVFGLNTVEGINKIIGVLRQEQSPGGSWEYPFETGIVTDAYMIILLRTLEINDEELIRALTKRILSKQEKNGAWKLFADEGEGNVTATAEAYYALLYSQHYSKKDKRLQAAKRFILANGGLENTHMFTKVMLSITGQHPWPAFFPMPPELILLPLTFPVNFYSFSVFGRANMTPIMILADKKYSMKTSKSPDLSDLYTNRSNASLSWERTQEWRSLYSIFKEWLNSLIGMPAHLHTVAIERAKQYMLDRIEPDGTFLNYFSSTFLMIFALLSIGYPKNDPIIQKAVSGIQSMKYQIKGFTHMQYTTATIWNTSLLSYAIQEAGVHPSDPMIQEANRYLLERQHYKYGDWAVHNQSSLPGGWGFSNANTIHPDIDDTTSSLRAIAKEVTSSPYAHQAWDRGIQWVLSMQNNDGGWPAFEKNTNSTLMELLPIEKGEYILTDPSSADLTGRTLEFLGNFTNINRNLSAVKKGVNWLINNQKKDGSWYGRWGICYIYGTWASITGLRAAGISSSHSSIKKAVKWLRNIQNGDGGWGESCHSDIKETYIPLGASTLTHTAWALDALIAAYDHPTEDIRRGINYLLENLNKEDWTTDYPKGQGMAGGFYMHYHSYRYIFPLLTLSHYRSKFN